MIVGIGLLGMITASIATYFIKGEKEENPTTAYIKGQLDRLDQLNENEIDTIIAILETSKNQLKNNEQHQM